MVGETAAFSIAGWATRASIKGLGFTLEALGFRVQGS